MNTLKAVVIRQYGRTDENWFGAAPYGEQMYVGDIAGYPGGNMPRLIGSNPDLDAAFGRHGRDGGPIVMAELELPEGAVPASRGIGMMGYYLRVPYGDLAFMRLAFDQWHRAIRTKETLVWKNGGVYLARHTDETCKVEPHGGRFSRADMEEVASALGAKAAWKILTEEEYETAKATNQREALRGAMVIKQQDPVMPPYPPELSPTHA